MTLTLRSHIDQLISELRQNREIPVQEENGTTTTITIDTRNFGTYFLQNHLSQSFNQYGSVDNSWKTYAIYNSWHNHEIPYYDDEQRYTPSETIPPPETSQAADWDEFTDIRCKVATRFVNNLLDTIINAMTMLVDGYITAMDCVKIICDALVDIFLVASIAISVTGVGASASSVSIPLGLVAKVVLEIAGLVQKYIINTTLSIFTSALENEGKRAALICAIYNNKTPEGILNGWKSAVDEEYPGILWPIQQLLKYLVENRHALALAEGVGKRSLEADCGACTANCLTIASVYTSFTNIEGGLYDRSVILPDGLVFTAKPGYPAIFTKPAAAAWTWRIGRDCYLGGGECSNMILYAGDSSGGEFWCGLMYRRFIYKPPGGSWGSQQPDWTAAPCSIIEIEPATTSGDWPHWGIFSMPPNTVEFQIFYESGNENPSSPNRFGARICKG